MPTTTEPKLDALISDCSLSTARRCFQKLGSFKRFEDALENPDPDRFTGFTRFGELPLESDTLLFAYAETEKDLTERSARKAQFDAARTLLKARGEIDAGIFIFRGANGAFRLSFITKIYKATSADFSHFRRYTYFVDPQAAGHHTFRKQIGGCAFDSLEAIQEAFSVEAINKDFYKELANWYFWAMKHVHFPTDDLELDKGSTIADAQKVREHDAKNLIRLLTRMLFVWFIKQRGLVPHELFDPEQIARDYLEGFSAESKDTRFYKAILQNFFFAALNQEREERGFTKGGRDYMDNMTVMRYEKAFKEPQRFLDTVKETTPFLNGGLFECLDFVKTVPKGEKEVKKKFYEDGFSDRNDNQIEVPDFLFFGKETTDDLRDTWGIPSKGNEPVQGLIHILNRYNFTIVENSPIEQEVALDPELLGKVFENLLASYNPETQTTARKQTGSFYTPRPIVDYMVDESLKAYLLKPLTEAGMKEDDAKAGLDLLFSYEEKDMDTVFEPEQVDVLIRAIDTCKILDPACGSGAFPMGILQKLVFVLGKLDPKNERWEQRQIDEARKIADPDQRRERIREIMDDFEANDDDYGRKLYLIENCLYGVDIQSIATQVTKLRFFISLVVDQKIDPAKDNFGVRPLPNLETKFVAADTLIAAEQPTGQKELAELTDVQRLKDELQDIRHKIFSVKTTATKQKYKADDEAKRNEIAAALKANGWPDETADRLARWDPYKQNDSAEFFDPDWMFGLKGFDVVIGNPPYVTYKGKQKVEVKDQYIKTLTESYPESAEYKINSYALFIDRGLRDLNAQGAVAFIIPSTILQNEKLEKIRKLILQRHDLERIVSIESKVFSAITDSVIMMIRNQKNTSDRTEVIRSRTYDLQNSQPMKSEFKSSEWLGEMDTTINIRVTPSDQIILRSIESHSHSLEDCVKVYVGIVASGMKKFLSSDQPNQQYKKYLQGRDLSKFSIAPRKLFINFDKDRLHSNTDESVYLQHEKVLVRKTGNYLLAAYDDEQFYTDQSIYNLYPLPNAKISMRSIACLLNSSCLNYFFRKKMITNPDVFPYIKGIHLKKLPMPVVGSEAGAVLDALCALAKINTNKRDLVVSSLIDACVMECYFREHMAERDLLFQDTVAAHLKDYDPKADSASQTRYLETLHTRLQATDLPQKLQAIPEKSPELLGVILKGGKV